MTLPLWADGPVEPKRPRPTKVRAFRGCMQFESKASALAWAARHAPLRSTGVRSLSAHPRACKTDLGTWALVYDGLMATGCKLVLLGSKRLGRLR